MYVPSIIQNDNDFKIIKDVFREEKIKGPLLFISNYSHF